MSEDGEVRSTAHRSSAAYPHPSTAPARAAAKPCVQAIGIRTHVPPQPCASRAASVCVQAVHTSAASVSEGGPTPTPAFPLVRPGQGCVLLPKNHGKQQAVFFCLKAVFCLNSATAAASVATVLPKPRAWRRVLGPTFPVARPFCELPAPPIGAPTYVASASATVAPVCGGSPVEHRAACLLSSMRVACTPGFGGATPAGTFVFSRTCTVAGSCFAMAVRSPVRSR
eukprot:COSAG02_NODE_17297_length_1014_cov_1.177049_2_plen_226_part_00